MTVGLSPVMTYAAVVCGFDNLVMLQVRLAFVHGRESLRKNNIDRLPERAGMLTQLNDQTRTRRR